MWDVVFFIFQVINRTGFMSGLYSAAEMNSDSVKVDYCNQFHFFTLESLINM